MISLLVVAFPIACGGDTTRATETITAMGITLDFPAELHLDQALLDQGGPISIDNFGGAYAQGGLAPQGGFVVNIAATQLPPDSITEVINRDLQGVAIEFVRDAAVGGEAGKEVAYTYALGPANASRDLVVYVPHGTLLYKFFLSYRVNDPGEATFVATFESILSSVRFEL